MSQVRKCFDRRGTMGESILTAQRETLMSADTGFQRGTEGLRCEDVPLATIAREIGTPCYVYGAEAIRSQYTLLRDSVASLDARLHYSVKANSSLAIMALLRELGAGLDIVSGGELYRALKSGFNGRNIVFSGVGKTEREMEEALEAGVLLF